MFIPGGNSSNDVEQLWKLSRQIPVKREGAQSKGTLMNAYPARRTIHPMEDQKVLV